MFTRPLEDEPMRFAPTDLDGDHDGFECGSDSKPIQCIVKRGCIGEIRNHSNAEALSGPFQNLNRFRPDFERLLKLAHVGHCQTLDDFGFDLLGSVSQKTEHHSEAFLAGNFPEVCSPKFGNIKRTLRKSREENVKVQFAELRGIGRVNGRRCSGDHIAIHPICGQFRTR